MQAKFKVWILVGITSLCIDSAQADDLADEVLARLQAATVFIEVEANGGRSWTGSGFFINGNGWVVTNYHITSGEAVTTETAFTVVESPGTKGEQRHKGQLIAFHPTMDLALIKTNASTTTWLDLSNNELKVTQIVFAAGFPHGRRITQRKTTPTVSVISADIVAFRRDSKLNLSEIDFQASALPGNSGGPLVDKNGHVVGVVSMRFGDTSMCRAMPRNGVHQLLANATLKTKIQRSKTGDNELFLGLSGNVMECLNSAWILKEGYSPILLKPEGTQARFEIPKGWHQFRVMVFDGQTYIKKQIDLRRDDSKRICRIHRVQVSKRKSTGKYWDVDKSPPEIELSVRRNGDIILVSPDIESFLVFHNKNRQLQFECNVGDRIEIRLVDRDVRRSDSIATIRFSVLKNHELPFDLEHAIEAEPNIKELEVMFSN